MDEIQIASMVSEANLTLIVKEGVNAKLVGERDA